MSDCIFKPKIRVVPSSQEFWPAGGWHRRGSGWARFYACQDTRIVRRAVVQPKRGGGWEFAVSEITTRGVLAVALQPFGETAAEATQCLHAADNCACEVVREARAL